MQWPTYYHWNGEGSSNPKCQFELLSALGPLYRILKQIGLTPAPSDGLTLLLLFSLINPFRDRSSDGRNSLKINSCLVFVHIFWFVAFAGFSRSLSLLTLGMFLLKSLLTCLSFPFSRSSSYSRFPCVLCQLSVTHSLLRHWVVLQANPLVVLMFPFQGYVLHFSNKFFWWCCLVFES